MEGLKKLFEPRSFTTILVVLQLVFKVWVELVKRLDVVSDLPVDSLFWSGTLAWVVILPLLIQGHRPSYLAASVFGILNGVVGGLFPLTGVCHHYFVGSLIFIHGLLIAHFGYRAYKGPWENV